MGSGVDGQRRLGQVRRVRRVGQRRIGRIREHPAEIDVVRVLQGLVELEP